jgi:hypothetical protein
MMGRIFYEPVFETSRGSRGRVGVTRKEKEQCGDEAGMPNGPVAWKSG